jgi:hypothetical protein
MEIMVSLYHSQPEFHGTLRKTGDAVALELGEPARVILRRR